jgi:dephospho-CoA kinase
MLKIGLTGGIGSGKSVVSQVFSQLGVPVYNADHMAKILVQTNHKLKKAIVAKFGEKSFTEQGYNTAYIAQLVFNNDNLLRALNRLSILLLRMIHKLVPATGRKGLCIAGSRKSF